jgi:tetratricopeptide (TPR) repeat protein
MKQLAQNRPNPAIERLQLEASMAWENLEFEKAIHLLERAARKEPGNPSLLLNLAQAYVQRYDFAVAERYIEKAVKLSPNPIQTLEKAGQMCLGLENVEMAFRYFKRASKKGKVSLGVLLNLVDMCIRDQRLEEAAEFLASADQKDSRVRFQVADLRRAQGKTSEAETLFRDLLADPATGGEARVRALYALGGILDAAGQYDAAMAAWREAKAIYAVRAAPFIADRQIMQSRATEMEQTITTEVLDRWRADAAGLQPTRRIALLCGHPRSGTTLLEQVLDAHSDVISAEETKLMHDEAYLPLIRDLPEGTDILPAFDAASPAVITRSRNNYFRCANLLLRRPIGSRLLLDKNPALNLLIPLVVRVFPETKFLIALRDPRDVVMSCFMQALPLTPVSSTYLSLDTTVQQYANVMGFWLAMRPRMGDQWKEIRYEEMLDDLPAVARSTLEFLGLGYEENVLKFYDHARTKRVLSPSHADVKKPLYRTAVGRWRNYEKYLEPYMAGLERFLSAFNYH